MGIRKYTVLLLFLLTAAVSAENIKVDGSFVWKRRKSDYKGTFNAVFTPDGKNKWKVVFSFKYKGKPHKYAGTATGSLENGTLEGTVMTTKNVLSHSPEPLKTEQ